MTRSNVLIVTSGIHSHSAPHRSGFTDRYDAVIDFFFRHHHARLVELWPADYEPSVRFAGAEHTTRILRVPDGGDGQRDRAINLARSFLPKSGVTDVDRTLRTEASGSDIVVGLVHPAFSWFSPLSGGGVPSILFAEEKVEPHVQSTPKGGVRRVVRAIESTASRRRLPTPTELVVIAPTEVEWGRAEFPHAHVSVVPHVIDRNFWKPTTTSPGEQAKTVLVVGHMSSPRTASDLRAIIEELDRQDTDGVVDQVCVITGSRPDSALSSLRSARLQILEDVRDPRPFYETARVVLVPPFYFRGVKTTVLQAWASMRPVVASTWCARTLGLGSTSRALAVGSTPFEVAREVLSVASSDRRRDSLVAAGWERLNAAHSAEAFDLRMAALTDRALRG